jgi:hypothetical protein
VSDVSAVVVPDLYAADDDLVMPGLYAASETMKNQRGGRLRGRRFGVDVTYLCRMLPMRV